ncbi:hypothetical protein A2Z22_01350 [Candidatus Woesebacteria bacterium RBG_16_34_12]|uniref:GH15-like domain-containing protein n=1 Tax=Candidatus Woesebacteria bacterium RBG_16_34_12 TaxID=1802480 RepID=A0A1F7XA00_9BACT|nr:MAG: hypothetical protein A2Z22_01350 [Candidatus Woesebacteria bacterium RBG_16_34_12]
MPKTVTLGNGHLLVCLDKFGRVKDLYYHYAGLENHVGENMAHRIGIWIDGSLNWLDNPSWEIKIKAVPDSMESEIKASNSQIGLELDFADVVYNERNIFIRKIRVKNLYDRNRNFKIYFNQQFNISQTHTGDTAYYDPHDNVIIHYKGRRVFLINLLNSGKGIAEYSVGLFGIEGKEGTFRDAEDGKLSESPIEYGQVDSVLGVDIDLEAKEEKVIYYWLTVAKSIKKVKELNSYVLEKTPDYIIKSTTDYWKAWINNQQFTFYGLSDQIIDLFKTSLTTIRTHVSKNGAIIASSDSDMLFYGRDTYSYMWPRDAAVSAIALAQAGDFNASRRFFEFCSEVISNDGYFLHKYRADKALGSSWHPWIRNGKAELPIQEDGTALIINALWTHFELSKDLEFIESIYNPLIKKAADFMSDYCDEKTGLPKPSYDLWEMKFGIHTFTASSVYGALNVAGKFASLLGKDKQAKKYLDVASGIKNGILKYLYNNENKTFLKHINFDKDEIISDKTIDASSVYGVYKFKVLNFDDPILKKAIEVTTDRLSVKTDIGGIARFEGDIYHSQGGNVPGNPWFITTLWMTQYHTEFLEKESEITEFVKRFNWVVTHATPSGLLSEQLNPYTGEHLSAAPLTWSHAEYVIAIINFLEKLEELGICKACYPVK